MGDWLTIFLALHKDRDHLALAKNGLVGAVVVGFFAGSLLYFFFEPNTWQTKLLLATPAIALALLWFVYHLYYYQSGKGVRIGLSFCGYKVDYEDLQITRQQIANSIRDMQLGEDVHIKLCEYGIDNSGKLERIVDMHNLQYAFSIKISPDKSDLNQLRYKIEMSWQRADTTDESWCEVIERHASALLGRPFHGNVSLLDLAEYKAECIADAILLAIALSEIRQQRFQTASKFAQALDTRLAAFHAPTEYPRNFLRFVDIVALMAPSSVDVSTIATNPAIIEKATVHSAQAVEKYRLDDPRVILQHSRNLVLLGRIDEAFDLLRNCPPMPTSDSRSQLRLALARAVVNLLTANWLHAGKYYGDVMTHPDVKNLDLHDLVEFAKYIQARGHIDEGKYMQIFYRRIRGDKNIDRALISEVMQWLNGDESRKPLRMPLNNSQYSERSGRMPKDAGRYKKRKK